MYAYNATLYCDDCGARIARSLPDDWDNGDSDQYPQAGPDGGETDTPNHCANGSDCDSAVDLYAYGLRNIDTLHGAESWKVGALLAEQLTDDGVNYAYEIVTEQDPTPYQRALHRLWRETFPQLVDRIEASARRAGIADGKAAGSWVVDGNTTEETARKILQGLDDGDPEILDNLPSGPLSGEYADGTLPRDVLGWYGLEETDNESDDVLRAYEDGWSEGMTDEVERSARAIAEPTVYDLLDKPPAGCDEVAGLYDWSTNYDPGRGPMTLYLDLLGWSDEQLGETLYDLSTASLGYLELSKLAAALQQYAERPNEVRAYVDQLMNAEESS